MSQNNIMVSIANNDVMFPDTPTTMLGDMKQLNFTMNGKYDFTYFYDQNTGEQIYPELYITMVDIVEDPSDTKKIEGQVFTIYFLKITRQEHFYKPMLK